MSRLTKRLRSNSAWASPRYIEGGGREVIVAVHSRSAAVMGIRDASFATGAAFAFDGESENRPYCSAVLSIVGLVAMAVLDAFEGAFERG